MVKRTESEYHELGLIVFLWKKTLSFLAVLSFFELARYMLGFKKWEKSKQFNFVDGWVIFHTIFSFSAIYISFYSHIDWLKVIVLVYGLTRVFEITIYQAKVIFIDGYKSNSSVKSYRRSIICLVHNFFEIIFWFASTYIYIMDRFDVINPTSSVLQAFYISFVTMTTFGPPNFNIKDIPAMVFIISQSFVGLFMTIISLAHFISLLPTPSSTDLKETNK